jgi:hydrogenase nickel incorporation protein HypB
MCTTCGCAAGETRIDGEDLHVHEYEEERPHSSSPSGIRYSPLVTNYEHAHADGTVHRHPHRHVNEPVPKAEGSHAPGIAPSRMLQIERDILSKNDAYAAQNRTRFDEQGIFALNLVSSPGSGKTTLLCRTLDALKSRLTIAVIEGDQQTSNDAERIRQTGVPALQINTGKGCHLDAHMVGHALHKLAPADDALLFIENVGNLVCPAAFDLGEAHKVAILSVTEGEDKPLKYPDMFRAASLLLINKIDLLPYVSFKLDLAIAYARRIHPDLQIISLSATTGEGFAAWLEWLEAGCAAQQAKKQTTVAALKQRSAELEAEAPLFSSADHAKA